MPIDRDDDFAQGGRGRPGKLADGAMEGDRDRQRAHPGQPGGAHRTAEADLEAVAGDHLARGRSADSEEKKSADHEDRGGCEH
jgi:hypothetical protein